MGVSKPLKIFTLGGLSILLEGESVKRFASKNVEALLVYLACRRHPQSREALADILWDERSQERAMGNIRVILSSLRKSLGVYFNIPRETAGINLEENVWIDVIELENHLASAHKSSSQSLSEETILHLEEAVILYRGRILDCFYLRDTKDLRIG